MKKCHIYGILIYESRKDLVQTPQILRQSNVAFNIDLKTSIETQWQRTTKIGE